MSKCIKTGLWLYLPQYNMVFRTDLHGTSRSFVFTSILKERGQPVQQDWSQAKGEFVATVLLVDNCFWQNGILVADPYDVEFNEEMLQQLSELQIEYGVKLPPSHIA